MHFDLFADENFDFSQCMGFFALQRFAHGRRGVNQEAVGIIRMMHAHDFAQNFVAYRFDGFHRAARMTGRAIAAQHMFDAFTGALAGHFNQTERRETVNAGLHAVFRQRLLEAVQYATAVIFIRHINKVDDDDAAEIT